MMPRAIVMMRPFVGKTENNLTTEELEANLSNLVYSCDFLRDNGVIFEYYMRVFGWPDYVLSLYGPNEGLLKHAIIALRESCGSIITSTIIGTCPEDEFFRVAEFRESIAKDLKNKSTTENPLESFVEVTHLEEAKNYLKFNKALLFYFESILSHSKLAKEYKCGLDRNQDLFKSLMEKIFFNNKNITIEEKDELLKNT